MPCHNCPDPLEVPDNNGCLQPIISSCVTYDGDTYECADIVSGANLNDVITSIKDALCNPYEFSCTELNACSIKSLSDISDTSPSIGQILIWNGTTYVPGSRFTCSDLAGCSIEDFGNVIITDSVSGDVLYNNGTNWVNINICTLLEDASCRFSKLLISSDVGAPSSGEGTLRYNPSEGGTGKAQIYTSAGWETITSV